MVVTSDAVLVADKSHDQRVKQAWSNSRSRAPGRTEATAQARTYRPWGWFQTMDEGPRFKSEAHLRETRRPALLCRSTGTAASTG